MTTTTRKPTMATTRMLNPNPSTVPPAAPKEPPSSRPVAQIMEVEVVVSKIKCGRCGHQFFPRAKKGGKTWCPGCGTWMDIPRVNRAG